VLDGEKLGMEASWCEASWCEVPCCEVRWCEVSWPRAGPNAAAAQNSAAKAPAAMRVLLLLIDGSAGMDGLLYFPKNIFVAREP
jgi:hypothetical protein